MKISKRGEYALRALIDIGIASQLGKTLVRIGELAEHEKLPVKFLEQILMQLKGGGFVSSKRGKQGGYYLRKAMDQITFGAVIRLVEGPLAPISCVSVTAYEKCSCPDEAHCGLRMIMLDVRNAIADILDKYTLADVVGITLGKMKRDRVPLPFLMKMIGIETSGSLPDAIPMRKLAATPKKPLKKAPNTAPKKSASKAIRDVTQPKKKRSL
jgi:Rrf2 family protein